MTDWNSSTLGADNDQVHVVMGLSADNQVYVCESYDIRMGVFDVPNEFSIRVGSGDLAREFLAAYPKGSPFKLVVGGQAQFTGYTDGFSASDDEGGTEITFEGRDILASVCDTEIEKEESFEAATHRELVEKAIARVNILKPFELDPPLVLSSNAANRVQVTGQNVTAEDDSSETELLQIAGSKGDAFVVLRTHLGETLINLLRRHLDAAGLFVWAGASGDIIVGVPNSKQPPLYKIVRKRGNAPTGNVVGARFRDTLKGRYSEVVLFGKTTGRKHARTTVSGAYTDDEVVNAGLVRIRVLRNMDITSTEHAEHLAKKELAACRRRCFRLEYTIAGHSMPSLLTGGKTRAVVAPDTVVSVDDDEYDLHGNFWVESVHHRRSPHTSSTLNLLSPDVLVFGDQAFPVAK